MKTYMVAGTGISGLSAARLLLETGERVLLYDSNDRLDPTAIREKCADNGQYDTTNLKICLGDMTREILIEEGVTACVMSPGIDLTVPFLIPVRELNIPIIGEIELAYCYSKGDILAITGTNGKTTTTSLVGAIMDADVKSGRGVYDQAFTVGNIGIPYEQRAPFTTDRSVTVAEISTFQLETATSFRPNVSAILNITPDHLNRHKTMECYIEMKEKITRFQCEDDVCVLNYNDPVLREFGKKVKTKVIYFYSQGELEEGVFLRDDQIMYKKDGVETPVCKTNEMNLIGTHNYENVMAAVAMTMAVGVSLDTIRETIRNFHAVEHRIEYTCTVNGVKYYNDSKGTNPDAAIRAVLAMPSPTVLIGGGYDKQSEYEEWIRTFPGHIKFLLLLGATKEKIAKACDACGFTAYRFVDTLEEAVKVAHEMALPGENVLLSPACASWDMFDNFEQRGRLFKEYARALEKAEKEAGK